MYEEILRDLKAEEDSITKREIASYAYLGEDQKYLNKRLEQYFKHRPEDYKPIKTKTTDIQSLFIITTVWIPFYFLLFRRAIQEELPRILRPFDFIMVCVSIIWFTVIMVFLIIIPFRQLNQTAERERNRDAKDRIDFIKQMGIHPKPKTSTYFVKEHTRFPNKSNLLIDYINQEEFSDNTPVPVQGYQFEVITGCDHISPDGETNWVEEGFTFCVECGEYILQG